MKSADALSPAQQAVADYYSRVGTRVGYNLVMGGNKHFGYYDAHHTTEKAAQERFFEKFIDLLDPGRNDYILDAGCGQGLIATKVARVSGAHVTGITVVPFEVGVADRLAHKRRVTHRTHFYIHDYSKPLPKGEKFDRIYAIETLSHAPDVARVLKNLYNHLRPGGKLVCIEYEFDYPKLTGDQKELLDFAKKYGALHGIEQFGCGEFVRSLKRAGFVDIAEEDWTRQVLPSFKRIRRLARPVSAVVSRLRLNPYFVNTTVARGYADMAEQQKFWFKAYSATKKSKA